MTPATPLIKIFPRLNESQEKALKRLGIMTTHDLLYHFPVRYSDMSTVRLIDESDNNEPVTLFGTLSNLKTKKSFRGGMPMAEGTLTDITGNTLKIVWFHQAFIAKQYSEGETVKLTGKISESKNGVRSLTNPEIERTPDMPIDHHNSLFQGETHGTSFGYAVYRESRGITSKWMHHAIKKILTSNFLEELIDPIPEDILKKYKLPNLQKALVWIHAPQKKEHADAARKRFAFEEVFLIQLAKQKSRREYEQHFSFNININHDDVQNFMDRFPFTPTRAQTDAIETSLTNMSSGKPMSRLIEGDVGSGKTFVAATLAYAVTRNRPRQGTGAPSLMKDKSIPLRPSAPLRSAQDTSPKLGEEIRGKELHLAKPSIKEQSFGALQIAYMAPTEVLATQLFENFIEYFRGTGTQIALITGSGCRKFPSKVAQTQALTATTSHAEALAKAWTSISKTQLLKWIANGEIPVVVGTHALISKKVQFKDLGLVIIDEQHRFGTNQRKGLARKDNLVPHYLSMTATPIPRTLALTIYGDLDLSVIDTMPKGRKPVQTEIVRPDKRDASYERIQKELDEGRQAYVICPRIEEPDPEKESALQLKSVKAEAKRLEKEVFPKARIDIMHSKMTTAKKEEVMKRFYAHEIDILVSTSVIEVGVNVPNATCIVIEGAERFGLAQLHQLRGRVMRSTHQPYCFLFADSTSKVTKDRLQAFVQAKNGFELAELDLQLRGSGDLAGLKQWGISDLGMEAIKNPKMVEFARHEAQEIIIKDPEMQNYPTLLKVLGSSNKDVHFE